MNIVRVGYQLLRERFKLLAILDTKIYRIIYRVLKGRYPSLQIHPRISVVAAMYNKERETPVFIEALLRQSFPYEYEIILVDDGSTDGTPRVARRFAEKLYHYRKLGFKRPGIRPYPEIVLFEKKSNDGQCAARNLAIQAARAEIVVILDADCIPNQEFLLAHYSAYKDLEIDAAFGPMDLETGGRDPVRAVQYYEANPTQVLKDMRLQDPFELRSFLNCIPRNYSARKQILMQIPFDPVFSYRSSDPDSGYGWEDIDLGMRLYKRGTRFEFLKDAFTVHLTHEPALRAKDQPLRSLKNFKKLHEKHPGLKYIARGWTARTYGRITEWLKETGNSRNRNIAKVSTMLADVFPNRYPLNTVKRLKILSYCTDTEYQYEIAKLPHDFVFLTDGMSGNWDYCMRPLPVNMQFQSLSETSINGFDIAILPFDELALDIHGRYGQSLHSPRGLFYHLMRQLKIPIIPLFVGSPRVCKDGAQFADLLGNRLVVVTSFEVLHDCGFKNARVIWPAIDPQYYAPRKNYQALVAINPPRSQFSGDELARYNNVIGNMPCDYVERVNPRFSKSPLRARLAPDDVAYHARCDYIDFIRRHTIYFNPSIEAAVSFPLIEAMMCGLAVVSVSSADIEKVIRHGVNGFVGDRDSELREYLEQLFFREIDPIMIGDRGRATALNLFNYDRFLNEWQEVIDRAMEGEARPQPCRQHAGNIRAVKG